MIFLVMIFLSFFCTPAQAMFSDWHSQLYNSNAAEKDAFFSGKVVEIYTKGDTLETFAHNKWNQKENNILNDIKNRGHSKAVKEYKALDNSMANFNMDLVIEDRSKNLPEHQVETIKKFAHEFGIKGPLIIADHKQRGQAAGGFVTESGIMKSVIKIHPRVKNIEGVIPHEFGHIYKLHNQKSYVLEKAGVDLDCPEQCKQLNHLQELQADGLFALKSTENARNVKKMLYNYINHPEVDTHPAGRKRYDDMKVICTVGKFEQKFLNLPY